MLIYNLKHNHETSDHKDMQIDGAYTVYTFRFNK